MSSFIENLYLKRALQQLQEENRQLKDILEAVSESPPVERIAPEVPPLMPVGVKPSLTSPGAKPTRLPKIPGWLSRGVGRGLGVLGGVGSVVGAAQLGYDTGTWINDTFIDPFYRPPKPTDDQLRPMPDEALQSPEDLYPSPTRMPNARRRNGSGGGGGGGGGGMMGG